MAARKKTKWVLGLCIDEDFEWVLARIEYGTGEASLKPDAFTDWFGDIFCDLTADWRDSPFDFQEKIIDHLHDLRRQHRSEFDLVEAVGVSTIGVVNNRTKRLMTVGRKNWKNLGPPDDPYCVDFLTVMNTVFDRAPKDIGIRNDATAKCLAEHRWQDDHKRVDRLCCAVVSHGLNIGLVDTREKLPERHPELGHCYAPRLEAPRNIKMSWLGCHFHRNCYEALVSRARILSQWQRDLKDLSTDEHQLFAEYIAHFCWTAAMATGPERIVISGDVVFPELLPLIQAHYEKLNAGWFLSPYDPRISGTDLKHFIQMGKLGENVGILGALEVARYEVISADWRRAVRMGA